MTDTKSIAVLKLLHPAVRQSAIRAYNEAVRITPKGIHPVITSTLRTFEESEQLYAQGRTAPGQIVTQAKPGQSYHNYGLALDFALQINGKITWDEKNPNWIIVAKCFIAEGWDWGGYWMGFKDYPHLEKRAMTWGELLAEYNAGHFIPGETYIDLT